MTASTAFDVVLAYKTMVESPTVWETYVKPNLSDEQVAEVEAYSSKADLFPIMEDLKKKDVVADDADGLALAEALVEFAQNLDLYGVRKTTERGWTGVGVMYGVKIPGIGSVKFTLTPEKGRN